MALWMFPKQIENVIHIKRIGAAGSNIITIPAREGEYQAIVDTFMQHTTYTTRSSAWKTQPIIGVRRFEYIPDMFREFLIDLWVLDLAAADSIPYAMIHKYDGYRAFFVSGSGVNVICRNMNDIGNNPWYSVYSLPMKGK